MGRGNVLGLFHVFTGGRRVPDLLYSTHGNEPASWTSGTSELSGLGGGRQIEVAVVGS